jgi:hypothetical protein
MIWEALLKGSALVTFTQGVMTLLEKTFAEEILPHRIYGTADAARIIGMDRRDVLDLVHTGRIKGTKVDGNYRILGSSILEYMSR